MTASDTCRSRTSAAYPIAFVAVAFTALVWLLGTRTDISVWQDFRRDVVVRNSFRPDEIADIRFFDSSPYSIWLASDLFVWRSIRGGELPLWDRTQAGGYSPLLNVQNGVMHPLRWLMAIVPLESAPSVLIVSELFLLALGAYLMFRGTLALSSEAAACGAICLALGGYSMSVIQFSGAMLPIVHAPWIVWAWSRWTTYRSIRDAWSIAVIVALLFISGHPLLIVTAGLSAALPIVWLAFADRRAIDVARVAAISSMALLLSAFAILPAALAASATWTYKLASEHGIPFRPTSGSARWDAIMACVTLQREPWDKLDGGSIAFYVGPVAMLLVIFGLLSTATRVRTAIVPILVILGFVLATPPAIVAWAGSATPLRFFKPWYLMSLLAMGVAMAAAVGAEAMLARVRGVPRTVIGVAVMVLLVLSLRPAIRDGLAATKLRDVSIPLLDELRREREPMRVVGLHGQTHLPNSGAITGLEDIRFSSPLLSERYREWFRLAAPEAVFGSFPTTIIPGNVESGLFGAFNVKYVIRSRPPVHEVHTFLPRPGERPYRALFFDPIPDARTHSVAMEYTSVTVFENRLEYHPRAHFARSAEFVSPGVDHAIDAMRARASGNVEVVESAERVPPEELAAMTAVGAADSVRVSYPSNRNTMIDTRSEGTRILVLHDAWSPGWRAWIDGKTLEVMPVSLISRGMIVPPGQHRIEMRFVPPGFVAGVIVSSLTAALMFAVAILRRKVASGGPL